MIGVGVFLGFAALFYTLLLGYAGFTLTLMGVLLALARRTDAGDPLLRLVVIGGDRRAPSR